MLAGDVQDVKAILFDVFGTVVDWRSSLIADLSHYGNERHIAANWVALVDAWRGAYRASMDSVRRDPQRRWRSLDDLHRESLERLVSAMRITGLKDEDLRHMTRAWHRLRPWRDSAEGISRLKRRFIVGTLSNGNVSLLLNMAKQADLGWDVILSAETFRHYKPDPEVYVGAARVLDLKPREVMLAAAHNDDLRAASDLGLRTAFIPRPTEYGPHQSRDFVAEGLWDLVADDIVDLAVKLAC